MSAEDRGRSSYLDLLISTLMEHEKSLDELVGKLEKIIDELAAAKEEVELKPSKTVERKEEAKVTPSDIDTLVYMRIKLNRQLEDIIKIIESLKE